MTPPPIPKKARTRFLPDHDWQFIRKWCVMIGIIFLSLKYLPAFLPPVKFEVELSKDTQEFIRGNEVKLQVGTGYYPIKVQHER